MILRKLFERLASPASCSVYPKKAPYCNPVLFVSIQWVAISFRSVAVSTSLTRPVSPSTLWWALKKADSLHSVLRKAVEPKYAFLTSPLFWVRPRWNAIMSLASRVMQSDTQARWSAVLLLSANTTALGKSKTKSFTSAVRSVASNSVWNAKSPGTDKWLVRLPESTHISLWMIENSKCSSRLWTTGSVQLAISWSNGLRY